MAMRAKVSKRKRFEILKRDGFRCVFCGATPQEDMLHIDHVVPISKGGSDDDANLVVACQPCNGGKSNVPLEQRMPKAAPVVTADDALEWAEQIRGYLDAQRDLVAARDEILSELCKQWEKLTGWYTSPQERTMLGGMLQSFAFSDIIGAMQIASAKVPVRSNAQAKKAFMYLCGIIRRWRETGVVTLHARKGRVS